MYSAKKVLGDELYKFYSGGEFWVKGIEHG
jgi:hypothetical protein